MSPRPRDAVDDLVDDLYNTLGAICNQLPTQVVLPAVGMLLVEVVVQTSRDWDGCEAFLDLLRVQFHEKWLAQDEPPARRTP